MSFEIHEKGPQKAHRQAPNDAHNHPSTSEPAHRRWCSPSMCTTTRDTRGLGGPEQLPRPSLDRPRDQCYGPLMKGPALLQHPKDGFLGVTDDSKAHGPPPRPPPRETAADRHRTATDEGLTAFLFSEEEANPWEPQPCLQELLLVCQWNKVHSYRLCFCLSTQQTTLPMDPSSAVLTCCVCLSVPAVLPIQPHGDGLSSCHCVMCQACYRDWRHHHGWTSAPSGSVGWPLPSPPSPAPTLSPGGPTVSVLSHTGAHTGRSPGCFAREPPRGAPGGVPLLRRTGHHPRWPGNPPRPCAWDSCCTIKPLTVPPGRLVSLLRRRDPPPAVWHCVGLATGASSCGSHRNPLLL